MTLAECISQARKVYGMSQVELARRCEMSPTAMNNIEKGYTPDPCFSHVRKIAGVLHLSLDAMTADLAYPAARRRPVRA